ncbi:Ltp family lipoprotein [Companilactobacillus kedongensis]|uniref:Ltp family lipoprotein n=1 Tax=Companilactobacillus kedongensis TaxID=2486004 RepID=UPI000F796E9D|nr:Ltp family lipoprotein [Companilactobacillus kedongensis]
MNRSKKHKHKSQAIYKDWIFWLIIVLFLIIGFSVSANGQTSTNKVAKDTTSKVTKKSKPKVKTEDEDDSEDVSSYDNTKDDENASSTETDPPQEPEKAAEPEVPADYQSALNKANEYSEMMHMSKNGIYDQLTSVDGEQFSAPAAQYAMDNIQADWNNNALQMAKQYQETMSMSPEEIRDQLSSTDGEKFTPEEADYAIQHLND